MIIRLGAVVIFRRSKMANGRLQVQLIKQYNIITSTYRRDRNAEIAIVKRVIRFAAETSRQDVTL